MPLEGEYEPSPWDWVRDQVAAYERSGGREANTLLDTGMPIIIVTTRGNRSGKLRKTHLTPYPPPIGAQLSSSRSCAPITATATHRLAHNC